MSSPHGPPSPRHSGHLTLIPLFTLLFVLVAAAGCARSDEEAIEVLLAKREKAIETRDIELYMSCISAHYNDRGADFEAIRKKAAEQIFSAYDSIDYTFRDRTIYPKGDRAFVVQKFYLEAAVGEKRRLMPGTETLELRRERGGWKIVGGL